MTLFNGANINPLSVIAQAQARLLEVRKAFEGISELQSWLSGQLDSDLEGAGFSASDLQSLRAAMADASALAQLYNSGTLPNTYTLPYTFGATQRIVIGPQ